MSLICEAVGQLRGPEPFALLQDPAPAEPGGWGRLSPRLTQLGRPQGIPSASCGVKSAPRAANRLCWRVGVGYSCGGTA